MVVRCLPAFFDKEIGLSLHDIKTSSFKTRLRLFSRIGLRFSVMGIWKFASGGCICVRRLGDVGVLWPAGLSLLVPAAGVVVTRLALRADRTIAPFLAPGNSPLLIRFAGQC